MRAVVRLLLALSLLAGLMMPAGATAFEPERCPSEQAVEASCIDIALRAALAPGLPEPQCQTQGLAVDAPVLAPRAGDVRITFVSVHQKRAGHTLFAIDPPPRA